jgi:hypothetical protein
MTEPGMTNEAVVESLGVAVRTVERNGVKARLLLQAGLAL